MTGGGRVYTGRVWSEIFMRLAILSVLISLMPEFALAHHGGSEYDMSKIRVQGQTYAGGNDQSAFVDLF
jgi:hypothetical protein